MHPLSILPEAEELEAVVRKQDWLRKIPLGASIGDHENLEIIARDERIEVFVLLAALFLSNFRLLLRHLKEEEAVLREVLELRMSVKL